MPVCYVCKISANNVQSKEEGLTFHRFPQRYPAILKIWREFAQCPEGENVRYLYLCSRHFRKSDIKRTPILVTLRSCAVPFTEAALDSSAADESALKETHCEMECRISSPGNCPVDDVNEENDESSHEEFLESVKQQLCRICGLKNEDLLLLSGEDTALEDSDNFSLEKKIEMYLPVKLSCDDGLPLKACPKCCNLVESWHELYLSCLAADSVLRKTFGSREPEVLSVANNEEDQEVARVQEEKVEAQELQEMQPAEAAACSSVEDGSQMVESQCATLVANLTFNRCRYCNQSFLLREEMLQHRKQCVLEPAICNICGKHVRERRFLNIHLKRHLLTPSLCEKCGSKLCSKYAFRNHKKKCLRKVKQPKYFCEPCCRPFFRVNFFKMHQERHKRKKILNFRVFSAPSSQVKGNEEHFICPVCKSPFQNKLSLIVHMNTGSLHSCQECKVVLQNEKEVFLHECREWTCRFCSLKFNERKYLRHHELLHKTDEVFTCKLCASEFPSMASFIKHQRVHKPLSFHCEACGKCFKERGCYKDHTRKHEGRKLACSFCDQKYLSRNALYRHKKKYHHGMKNISI